MFFFPARISSPIWLAAQLHKQLRQHSGGADRGQGLHGLVRGAPPMKWWKGIPAWAPSVRHQPPARTSGCSCTPQPSSWRVFVCPALLPHTEGKEQQAQQHPGIARRGWLFCPRKSRVTRGGLLPCSPRYLFQGCPGRQAKREVNAYTRWQPGVTDLELREKLAERSIETRGAFGGVRVGIWIDNLIQTLLL